MDQAQQLRNIIKNQSKPQRPLARIITVTSGKGGVGKSNVAINLAVQFRKMGKRVIILDADFGLANIEIMFGTIPKHNLYIGKSKVGIKDYYSFSHLPELNGEIDGNVTLANSALSAGDGNDPRQRPLGLTLILYYIS